MNISAFLPAYPLMRFQTFLYIFSFLSVTTSKPGVVDRIAFLEASNSSLLDYPTQFTQDIVPKQIHSHNDYWRDVPLLTALSAGVSSVEADVWLDEGNLYVGHEAAALTPARTFESLYVDPLMKILALQNPISQDTPNGVFDTDGSVSLQLLVDIKTDGLTTLPFVLAALDPLREAGYLTTYVNGTLKQSVVTVVGTGNSPAAAIKLLSPRDFFYDAPLSDLSSYDSSVSPLASTDYAQVGWNGIGNISDAQLAVLQTQVAGAHAKGIKARYWDIPGWPIEARANIWAELMKNGVDWLNADDLEAASKF